MPTVNLTQKFVEAARAKPGMERTRHYDSDTHGLCLMVTGRGARSLSVHYRLRGDRTMRIMTLPTLKLKEARKLAIKMLGDVADGSDGGSAGGAPEA